MGRYQDGWVTAAAALGLCGGLAAFAALGPGIVLPIFVCVSLFAAGVLLCQQADDGPGRRRPRAVLSSAVLAGAGAVAACGLFAVLGPVGVLLVLGVLLSCPWVLRRAVRALRRRGLTRARPADEAPPEPAGPVVAEPPPVAFPTMTPAAMDLEELCWAWRRSYVHLQRCRTVAETARVVAERQQCLDELERRNPGGLCAWLESGARAAGDPSRYVNPVGPTDCRDTGA